MQANFHLKDEIFEKLQNKSRETGIDSDELLNEILNQGLDNYPNMIKLSDKFQNLRGICESGNEESILEVRENVRERRIWYLSILHIS